MDSIVVHPRVMERHPEISESDVRTAWQTYVRMARRDNGHCIAVGFDGHGRALEMVAKEAEGDYLICRALTPPTVNALKEPGMTWR